jgi:hypothetical protein
MSNKVILQKNMVKVKTLTVKITETNEHYVKARVFMTIEGIDKAIDLSPYCADYTISKGGTINIETSKTFKIKTMIHIE